MSSRRPRRTFSKEFKIQTVKLITDGERPLKQVAKSLEIQPAVIRRWKREYLEIQEDAFPGKGNTKPSEEEFRRLRKELIDAQEENAILKKALAIFSKQPK